MNQNTVGIKRIPHIFAEDINVPAISSTMIRDAVKSMDSKGLPPNFFNWCSPYVFSLIYEQGLYRNWRIDL